MSTDYEVSAPYVSFVGRVLEQQRLRHVCPAAAAPMLDNPWARWWWPGSEVESIFVALRRLGGDDAMLAVSESLLRQHMLPAALPIVSWLVSLSGVRPATLFARLDLLAKVTLRGVRFEWTSDNANAGTVRIHYPAPAQDPEVTTQLWSRLLAQTFVLTHVDGEVTAISSVDGVLEAQLAWE